VATMDVRARSGFKGPIEDPVAVLDKFATSKGPSFCQYQDESENTVMAKLIHGRGGIKAEYELLGELHKLCSNLSFTKKTMLAALDLVYKKHKGSSKQWSMQDDQRVDWRETLQRRIRNCCRVVQQGQLKVKGKPPQWIAVLPWKIKGSGESEAES